MPLPFQQLDPDEFVRLLVRFPLTRRITAIHLHHTWRPRTTDWHGHRTLRALWSTDTLQRGWSDIAQHLTIAPDGSVWTGRSWNRPPCSCPATNGSREGGPFMIMLVGDLTAERFEGPLRDRTIEVVGRLQRQFELGEQDLYFHRDLAPSLGLQCPGTSVDLAALRAAVTARVASLDLTPGSDNLQDSPPFSEDAENWYQFIVISTANGRRLEDEPADAGQAVSAAMLGEDRG